MTHHIDRFNTYVDGNNVSLFIARAENSTIIGQVELLHCKRRIAAVRRLYVDEKHRLEGIGRSLMDCCLDTAKASHCEALSLLVQVKNVDAHAFYRRIGFSFAYQDDDDYILTKDLRPPAPYTGNDRLWPKRDGMRQSIHGVLKRLVPKLTPENDPEAYRTVLREFDEHLDSLALAFYSGDYAAVDQFLQLYDLDSIRAERQKQHARSID